jgi:hypothetical protein
MNGNLYNILGDGVEELYWCEKEIDEDVLAEYYRNWEESEFSDFNLVEFEEWWNEKYPDVYIHRVYLNEIYI